ncbi:MAG: GIY-YIG nuclease family protein [Bacteroidetes bacterium]|nr:GIY-YIG nuclease family protein [Bacteroidota bacterium]
MNCCYIIFSPSINKYYIGATHEGFATRLENHNSVKYGSKSYSSIT